MTKGSMIWVALLGACAEGSTGTHDTPDDAAPADDATSGPHAVHLAPQAEAFDVTLTVVIPATRSGAALLTAEADLVLVARAANLSLSIDGAPSAELGFAGPHVLSAGEHELVLGGPPGAHSVVVRVLGALPANVAEARSLAWRDPVLLDDPSMVGLGRLLGLLAADGHGGELLAAWLHRFGTTAHSERAGPVLLAESLEAAHGADPSQWLLDELPFTVTTIHNRLDLRSATHCGEFRVSMACVDPAYQPFHLIFRFRQEPHADDLSPSGVAHCAATALRWASLSSMSPSEFLTAATALIDSSLSRESFIDAESVEFIISPWEWRQWDLVSNTDAATSSQLPLVFDNPPLFQTVDIPTLNEPGALRSEFLAFVEANAAALASRSLELPARFRAASTRVNAGVPWVPLDLGGVAPAVLAANPNLRQQIEIVGCPACHATDAEFVQTRPDRTFSPFYQKELLARADDLLGVLNGEPVAPRFGPLQAAPVLPP